MKKGGVIAVIGGNAAGPAAAARARRANPSARVLLFEKGEYLSTGSCELPFLLSGEVESFQSLIHFTPESFYREKQVEAFIRHEVMEINRRGKFLLVKNLASGEVRQQPYDSLILCTGSVSRSVPGLAGYVNVFNYKTIADYLALSNCLRTGTNGAVAILGAGYIGLEVAEALTSAGHQVTLLELAESPLPGAEPEIQKIVLKLLTEKGVSFRGRVSKTGVAAEGGRITYISAGNLRVECVAVVCATGFQPATQLAAKAGLALSPDGFILLNQRCQTSDSSVYAAGDCAAFHPHLSKFPAPGFQAVHARETARVAAVNAAGGTQVYTIPPRNTSFRLFNSFVASVGFSLSEAVAAGFVCAAVTAEAWDKPPVMPGAARVFGKLVFDKRNGAVLGASFFGSSAVSGYADVIALSVAAGINIGMLRKPLWNYTPALSSFTNLLSLLAKAAQEVI